MPQIQLPIFPSGVTHITPELAFKKETPQVLLKVQQRLDDGDSVRKISDEFGINYETVKKAVTDGRLKKKANSE